MRRSTLAVLIAVAMLAAGVFLLRRDLRVEEAPRPRAVPPAEPMPAPQADRKPTEPPAAPATTAPPPAASAPATVAEAARPGILRGTVKVEGAAPPRKRIRMDADPACAALHAEPLLSDALVRDAEHRARWAFVCVRTGLEGRTFAPPADPVTLAQVGCRYDPHVLGIQVGQPLVIVNQDPLLHNIHALSFVNHAFNFCQSIRGLEERKTFTATEMIPVRCDVHPWMSAWIGAVEHPYFAVTDAAGAYSIAHLPPGRYRIEAWHEACDAVSKEVDVTAGAGVDLDFVLDLRK